MSAALKIFIIYAREDRGYKDDLLKSLKLLQTQGLIEPWHDSDIKPGDEWDKEIKAHLRAADIILPIISFDFFDSDYIHRVEIVEAFERYDRGEAIIIPIIADSCPWTDYPRLKDFQALPAEGRPIDDWPDRKKAMSSIYEGIKWIILGNEAKDKAEVEQRRKAAKPFFDLGEKARDLSQKRKNYSKAIELDPNYAEAYYYRGNLNLDLKRYEEAIKDYDQAILINSNYSKAYLNRGNARLALKQYDRAIKDYDQAISFNPKYVEAYCNRGIAKHELGQYADAIKDFNQSIRFDPNDADAYYLRGLSKVNLGKFGEARRDYRKSLNIDPEHRFAKDDLRELEEKLKQKP